MSSADSGPTARHRMREKGAICFEFDRDGEAERIRTSNTLDPTDYPNRWIDRDAREFGDAPPALPLPGSGGRLDDCGDDFPALFCEDCGEPAWVGRTCRRSRCPRCHKAWIFHTAKTIAAKTDGQRRLEYARSEGRQQWYNHHLVVSLPPSIRVDSDAPLDRVKELAKLIAAQVDAHSGTLIYHPYRIATEHRGDVLDHDSGSGDMTWKDVLPLIASEGFEAVREEYLVFEPHFHIICASDWIEGGAVTRQIEEDTGIVVERITPGDSSKSIPDLEALARVTAYSLSHAGLHRDSSDSWRGAYWYFGETHGIEVRANVLREVDRELRKVAPTVLGMEFPEPRCSEDRLDTDTDDLPADSPARGIDRPPVRVLGSEASSGDSGSTNTGFPDSETAFTDERGTWDSPGATGSSPSIPADASVSKCGSRLVPMRAAPDRLTDSEWCEGIADSTLSRLRKAHAEYLALGGGDTDPPPVPPPD